MRIIEAHAAVRLLLCRTWRATQKSRIALLGVLTLGSLSVRELLRRRPANVVEVEAVFVTDCSEYQEWLTQAFLTQWRKVGRSTARLTRVLACDPNDERMRHIVEHSKSGHPDVELYLLPELNGKGRDRYLCNNRPRGLRRWLRDRPPRSNNHWIALLDPDMLLLRPLTTTGFWRIIGGTARSPQSARLVDVLPGFALAHHFPFVAEVWKNLNLSLVGLCAGAGGGVSLPPHDCMSRLQPLFDDPGLVAAEYAVGVPHIIRAVDLSRMADSWEVMTDRVRAQYRGWTAEMFSWILSARLSDIRFAYLAEVVSDPAAPEPAWARIDAGLDDTCGNSDGEATAAAPATQVAGGPDGPLGPWLVHYCEVYNITYALADGTHKQLHLDKRAVTKVLRANAKADPQQNFTSLLECDAPLFEVPPHDIASHRPSGPSSRLFRRSAWMLCTTLRAINAGLRDFKRRSCPQSVTQGADKETLHAAPMEAQLADMLFRAVGRLPKTVDWSARLDATRKRLRRRGNATLGTRSAL